MSLAQARAVLAMMPDHRDWTIARACSIIIASLKTDAVERADAEAFVKRFFSSPEAIQYLAPEVDATAAPVAAMNRALDQIRRAFHVQV
ncbi:hypothetical protein [Thalassovita sp.]|uniref:hypothetical protein n=1 Tax=Thalassovita sp. TaxID=1979401 RepID=UPI002AB1E226|nr:hypothetical protein [Thalassovita sp.]